MTNTLPSLAIEPLEKSAFAPFGDVIDASGQPDFLINNGMAERFHNVAIPKSDGGRISVSIIRAHPQCQQPHSISMLERHPLSSQAFIPLDGKPFLVIVAKKVAPLRNLRAFLTRSGQGINYRQGIWHHPLLALQEITTFLVIDRDGPGNNCEEYFFQETEKHMLIPPCGVIV